MIEVTIKTDQWQEVLIALMSEMGYEGFEQEGELLRAYAPEKRFDLAALKELLAQYQLEHEERRLEERNWNEEWEKNFQPVTIGTFCAVRADFHEPIAGVEHELLITPKMSFGTGHHATTHMMIEAMQHLELRGKRVLDFGTGTEVLAILAEKLGAAEVVGIDNDDWSIANAQENIEVNGCNLVKLRKIDSVSALRNRFDVLLANINKHVIIAEMAAMEQHLGKGGVILLSGLLENDYEDIENEAVKSGLSVSGRGMKGAWICVKLQKATA